MSKSMRKRPFSARRNIKQETFSKVISSNRLRKIQSLLSDTSAGDSGPNAVLCLLGIDGRYNDGSKELADYLLFDFFESQRHEIERSGIEEERIDDMMFCIRHDAVDVYCNPLNLYYLTPYIMHWRNLRLHCMNDKDYEDDEAAEEFKIKSLVIMVDGCSSVGIPNCRTGQKKSFDKMQVEKWPIIQAFALEGYGSGGFFTMNHEVSDISSSLWQIYQDIDPCNMETHITEHLPLLERQWKTMSTIVDVARHDGFLDLTENTLVEPLNSYFSHGIAAVNNNKLSIPNRHPYVLFGKNASRKNLEENYTSYTPGRVDKSGVRGQPAMHMVSQIVSPKAPYSCTRTYFFGNPAPIHPSFASKDAQQKQHVGAKDLALLNSIYVAVVNAVQTAILIYSKTLSVHQAEDAAMNVLSKLTKLFINEPLSILGHLSDSNKLKFSIEVQDNTSRPNDLVEGRPTPHVKLARMAVYDIPSVEYAGENLGSVVFSESFLDSSVSVLGTDGSIDIDSDHIVLTNSIPHYCSWPYACGSNEANTMVQYKVTGNQNADFGRALIQGDTASLLTDKKDLQPLKDGQTYVYQEGLVFLHSQNSPIIIPKNQLQSIQFYDGDSPSTVALLIMQYKPTLQQYLPQQLWTDSRMLLLAFQPKSKAYKTFFSEVLQVWKNVTSAVPMQMLGEDLPDVLIDVHLGLQRDFKAQNDTNPSKFHRAKTKNPSLIRFFDHLEASTCLGTVPVSQTEIVPVLGLPYDMGRFDDNEETVITVLAGIPGSHKENLCTTLTNLAKEDNRWAVIKTSVEKSSTFNPTALQQKLTAVIQTSMKKRTSTSSSKKKRRVLLVTPGFTDTVDVIQAILNHPNKDIARKLKIGAVTVCIDAANTYMTESRYTFPHVLDQCAEGWVNNVVFTNSSSVKLEDVESVQSVVRSVNSNVALMMAEFGEVTRTSDINLILSESAFNEGALVKARHLSCPGWVIGKYRSGKMYPHFHEVAVHFTQPLVKANLINKLRELKKLLSPYPFHGNVYQLRGKIQLSDTDQTYELQYSVLSNHLNLNPVDNPLPSASVNGGSSLTQSIVSFSGCALNEVKLKDWLRGCAKQKPERKNTVTRKDLPKSEIKKIQAAHHLDALPEGWFYNGNKYVSLGGERTDMHPEIDKFINDHLETVNAEIDKHNAQIELDTYKDLFE